MEFPESHKQFLRQYGCGGLLGITITGVRSNENSSVVLCTKEYRKLGLDINHVVIEEYGEFIMCLDTSQMLNSKCPVVSWDSVSKIKLFNIF